MENTKNHHSYEKQYIGASDGGFLVIAGCATEEENQPVRVGLKAEILSFGNDTAFSAYIVDNDCIIPDYYTLEMQFDSVIWIYDDRELVREYRAKHINIYRAAEMGCIIQLLN